MRDGHYTAHLKTNTQSLAQGSDTVDSKSTNCVKSMRKKRACCEIMGKLKPMAETGMLRNWEDDKVRPKAPAR